MNDGAGAVYGLAVVVAALAFVGTLAHHGQSALLDLPVPTVALVLLFALAERFPIHLEHRHQTHSFSLSTIPLVIGLYAVDPAALVVARVLGGGLVLVVSRRQVPVKLATNLASFGLEVVVAVAVLRLLAPADLLSLGGWAAATAAAVASDAVQVVVISLAISVFTRRLALEELWATLMGTAATVFDTWVALIAVTLLVHEPAALVLLLALPGILFAAYRANARLHSQHEQLERLFEFVRNMGDAVLEGALVERLLRESRELLHADTAWLYLPAPAEELSEQRAGTRFSLRADEVQSVHVAAGSAEARIHQAFSDREPSLVEAEGASSSSELIGLAGHRQALVGSLNGAGGAMATIVVADRSGQVRSFNAEDRRLFETLVHHARIALDNSDLIDRLRTEAAKNEYLSLHDALTDLPNRAYFDRVLADAPNRYERLAVLLLDLDRFKEINDTLGHHTGDRLLRQVGARLRRVLRESDAVARLGGDEFAVLLPDVASVGAAAEIAASLGDALQEPFPLGDVQVEVAASIGIAVYPDHGDRAETLFQRADVAMYLAKNDKSGHVVYSPERDDSSTERLTLVGELRAAIAAGDIAVHYQPQIHARSSDVIGVEALARWIHPVRGFVSPEDFVRVAENTGLIGPLTDHVLGEAVRQCARWRAEGHEMRVSVNLSARNLVDAKLVDTVRGHLRAAGLPPALLCLEITETCAMADAFGTESVLLSLRELGVRLAIDDFGTGYSSLAYLHRLPVDEVKFDKSFTAPLSTGAAAEARATEVSIVRAITALANQLDLEVVAEGVETETAFRRLSEFGCTAAQGYLFSKPLPAADFQDWLERWRAEQLWEAPDARVVNLHTHQRRSRSAAGARRE